MARRKYAAPLAIDLFRPLERDGATLLSDQLTERIALMIATGRLKANEYLPPVRLVAAKLRVNVATVTKAYEALRRRGQATTDSTRGCRVTPSVAQHPPAGQPWASPVMRPVVPVDPLGVDLPRPAGPRLVRFHVSEPGTDLMPADLVARAFAAALRDGEGLRYAPLAGLPETLAAAERYLRQRGVALADAEVLLTTGTTQSLAIITRALMPPGGVVLTEHPTWHVALSIFAAAGARVVALPVDNDGMQIAALEDAVLRHNPTFLYLQPSYQNPTGASLSAERRADLLAMARKFQLPVVEDDFGGEVAFRAIAPPLRAGDGGDVVVYLKSFAKLLAPALRVGLVVAPTRYARVLRNVKHGLDPFVSAIAQRALAECLTSAGFEPHVRALTAELHRRWQALDQALRERMPAGVRWTAPSGGFCAWMQLPARIRPEEFIRDAARRGVDLAPGRLFCVDDSGDHGLRLAFAATTTAEIQTGVAVMAESLEAQARGRRLPGRVPHAVAP